MLDIVDIKVAAKKKQIEFYVKGQYIYCRDCQNGETVAVKDDIPVEKFKKDADGGFYG